MSEVNFSPKSPRWKSLKQKLDNADSNPKLPLLSVAELHNLGSGAFSVGNFRAHSPLGGEIVVKVAHMDKCKSLEQEVKLTLKLKHPNLRCAVGKMHRGVHYAYAHFQFVPGYDLFALASEHSPPFPTKAPHRAAKLPTMVGVRSVFRKVLQALVYLHGLDIVHNDVKPENIVVHASSLAEVNSDTGVWLMDLGLSFKVATQKMRRAGSPMYVAPEKFEENAIIGLAADIFSMGLTLHAVCSLNAIMSEEHLEKPDFPKLYIAAVKRLRRNLESDNTSIFAYDAMKEAILVATSLTPELRPSAAALLEYPIFSTVDIRLPNGSKSGK